MASGAPPPWWSQRAVVNSNPVADYTAINQGQLKNFVTGAAAELDADLPSAVGGAGDALHSQIAAWSTPGESTADYTTVNLGQLKGIAKLFYDQLIAVSYTNDYPWNATAHPAASDYNMANIGQVKNLFSFDLTSTSVDNDTNNDGIPDWWERYYGITNAQAQALRGDGFNNLQAWQNGLNPNDYYSGATPVLGLTIVSGNGQTGPANGLLPQPLIVSVTDSHNNPLVGFPVSFTTSTGALQASSIGTPNTSITARTDGSGQAKAFLMLPNTTNASVTIGVTAGLAPHTAQTNSFTEYSDDGSSYNTYINPFAPSQVTANENPDGSTDITWINNTDAADTNSINIRYHDISGDWVTAITVPAGITSYHFPPQ